MKKQKTYSEGYYLAQLLERLENLEISLTHKINPQAELIERTQRLVKELRYMLTQPDSQAMGLLEYALLPKINRLLLDTRQELKLKNSLQRAGAHLVKTNRREQLIQERLNGPAPHPYPPAYQPIPRPIHDAERKAMIEDALIRLKMLLSDS